jgi:hypothetical protein
LALCATVALAQTTDNSTDKKKPGHLPGFFFIPVMFARAG